MPETVNNFHLKHKFQRESELTVPARMLVGLVARREDAEEMLKIRRDYWKKWMERLRNEESSQ